MCQGARATEHNVRQDLETLYPQSSLFIPFFLTGCSYFYLYNSRVANAGINQVKPLLDITEEDFRRMFAVNVFGVQNCYAEAAKQMLRQGTCRPDSPGKIIGAASISAFKPDPLVAHYAASKWAVRGLTQSYAQGLAPSNINVNAYAPGIVGTDMWDLLDAGFAEVKGVEQGSVSKLPRIHFVPDLSGFRNCSIYEGTSAT